MRAAALRSLGVAAAILALHLVLFLVAPALGAASVRHGLRGFGEVLAIVPAVLLLIAFFEAWVPRSLVERNLGSGSGWRGMGLALFLGTAAAGPIYAAFPVGVTLLRRGCRIANLVIFLGAWATIKIPMLLLEGAFLGLRFALLRLAFTVPGIVAVGLLVEHLERRGKPWDTGIPGGSPCP